MSTNQKRNEFEAFLAGVYVEVAVPVDRLPYTEAMDRIVAAVAKRFPRLANPAGVWSSLILMRKNRDLPRLER